MDYNHTQARGQFAPAHQHQPQSSPQRQPVMPHPHQQYFAEQQQLAQMQQMPPPPRSTQHQHFAPAASWTNLPANSPVPIDDYARAASFSRSAQRPSPSVAPSRFPGLRDDDIDMMISDPRYIQPFTVTSPTPSESPLPLGSHSYSSNSSTSTHHTAVINSHINHHRSFSANNGVTATKQQMDSPQLLKHEIVSPTSSSLCHDGELASLASPKSTDSSGGSSTTSTTNSSADNASLSPMARIPFPFIVHLRSGDRSFLPRKVYSTLNCDVSDVLFMAAGVREFVAAHTEGATRTADGSIGDLPIAQARLSAALTEYTDWTEKYPVFKPKAPVLLPANTQLGMPFVPPLVSSGKKHCVDSASDDDDDAGPAVIRKPQPFSSTYLSDPINIHVLFDLAENVKPCTRLGCVNMMVKKSSRRACDECQNNGHQFEALTLRKLYLPENLSQLTKSAEPFAKEFLSLSVGHQSLILSQLNEAIETAIAASKAEYWKFHIPEDQAYVFAFPSLQLADAVAEDLERLLNPVFIGKDHSHHGTCQSLPVMMMTVMTRGGISDQYADPHSRSHSSKQELSGQSDSEHEPQLRRKNSHSHSHSSNSVNSNRSLPSSASSRSSGNGADRSTMSTASSGSSHSTHLISNVSSPMRPMDSDRQSPLSVLHSLPNLVPDYHYVSHWTPVSEECEYWVRMKSHFWKLEVRPKSPASDANTSGKKQAKTKSYRKVGKASKRLPARRQRTSLTVAAGDEMVGGRAHTPPQMATMIGAVPTLSPDIEFAHYANTELTWPHYGNPMVGGDAAVNASTENDRPRVSLGNHSHHSSSGNTNNSTALHGNAPPQSQPHYPHHQQQQQQQLQSYTPVFSSDHPLSQSLDPRIHDDRMCQFVVDEYQPTHTHARTHAHSDGFLPPAVSTQLTNNSVLVHSHDHDHLIQSKPIGATLNIYHNDDRRTDGLYQSDDITAVSGLSPTPVLLIYRDAKWYHNDVRQGLLPDFGGSGDGSGGRGGRYDGGDRKDGGGGRGGGYGRRRDDFEDFGGGNDKRRRVDMHHLALGPEVDPVYPSGAQRPNVRGDADTNNALDAYETFKTGSEKFAPPPVDQSKLAALWSIQRQGANIWLVMLVVLTVASLALFIVNFTLEDTPLNVLRQVPNQALIDSHRKSTMVNAASLFNQMRVSSPVFNAWISTAPNGNVILVDDDDASDIAYKISMKQLDVIPGSVVSPFSSLFVQPQSTYPSNHGMFINYSEVLSRCGQATNTAKGVADFLVSANALGQAFSYHFIGTEISTTNSSINLTAAAEPSSTGPGGNYLIDGRDSSSTSSPLPSSSSSTGASGDMNSDAVEIGEYILDWGRSTLSFPPKPDITCSLMEHEVGETYIKSSLCAAVRSVPSPYATLLQKQCKSYHFNCTRFLTDIFAWNLTNTAFAIETAVYSADPLMIALHYRQEVAALAPVCSYFRVMTHETLDTAIASANQGQINIAILLALILGGAALFITAIAALVLVVFWARKELAKKQAAPIPARAIVAVPVTSAQQLPAHPHPQPPSPSAESPMRSARPELQMASMSAQTHV